MPRRAFLAVVVAAVALWVAAASPILVVEDEPDSVSLVDEMDEAPSLFGESEIMDLKEAEGTAAPKDLPKGIPVNSGKTPAATAKKAGKKAEAAATEATTAAAKTANNAKASANDAAKAVTAAAKAKHAIAKAQAKDEKPDPRAKAAAIKAEEERKKKAKAKAMKAEDAEAGAKILDVKKKKKIVKKVSKAAGKGAKNEVVQGVKKGNKQYKNDEKKLAKATVNKDMIAKTGNDAAALPGPPIDKASRKKMTKVFHKTNSKEWLAYKNKEDAAWDVVQNTTVVSDTAKAALKTIEAENEVIRSKWLKVDISGRDPFACTPVPKCLGKIKKCTDSYDAANCIKARRGSVNLCELSESIQHKCCQTCRMSNLELCKKERLILAGFGDAAGADADKVAAKMRNIGFDPGSCTQFTEKESTKLKQNKLAPNFKKAALAPPKKPAAKPAAKTAAKTAAV